MLTAITPWANKSTNSSLLLQKMESDIRIFRNKWRALGYVALAASWTFFGTAPASADVSWNWSYSCSLLVTQTECKGGSGTFTTTDLNGSGTDGYYVVTAMTGEIEGNTFTSLIPPGENGKNNNKLSISGSLLAGGAGNVTGIDFYTSASSEQTNQLYAVFVDYVVGYYMQLSGPGFDPIENIDFKDKQVGEVAAVPGESSGGMSVTAPSSLLVFSTAAALMFGFTLRKVLN